MTADRAALVEKVARAICKADGTEPDSLDPWMGEHQHPAWEDYEEQATAAIDLIRAEVLEEAAKVADVYGPLSAAAIRALKGDNNG
jgi:hypothetical protein